ncbi:MAG TPA: hypothetical protein PKK06_08865 [Phycisphaerae bacterium]|nr:hypothetical protein [Phycisphaerae bacterium]HNU45318.1 hypothetical protein [Phycisphaerae bacterium]
MIRKLAVGLLVTLSTVCPPAPAEIIDHDDIAGVASLPQSIMDAIGRQRWFFAHASVGGNMISGLGDLHAADPSRHQLVSSSVSYLTGQMRAADAPIPTSAGTVYRCSRGNPGWQDKLTILENSVHYSGWHVPSVDAVMNKFCYIDETADAAAYTNSMSLLEAAQPDTVFVYMTMPLMTGEDYANVQRNLFNAAVRAYCIEHDRLLFDIADMEAHDPAGNEYTFTYGGQTYQKLYGGYTSDGGHLNTTGRQRIALGWYATAAALATGVPADLDFDRDVDLDDFALFASCLAGPGVTVPPPGCDSTTYGKADVDGDSDVDVSDLAGLQNVFAPP